VNRKHYPSDVSDEEWMFVAPYLTLMREDALQREYSLREVFDGLRWVMRAGAAWRMMPGECVFCAKPGMSFTDHGHLFCEAGW